jgi:predicted transglutaminase-like cysteine proteinase
MYRVVLRNLLVALPLLAAQPALAGHGTWVDWQNMRSQFMRTYGQSMPPIGHIRFCRANPQDCRPDGSGAKRVKFTARRSEELAAINTLVNRNITPVPDQELYGVVERWTYPVTSGDCEDYALLKRRMLMEHGWPAGALLITVVTDENGDGHAVLTVRTSKGDLILDNKNSKILAWNKVPYRFYKRQSYLNPSQWVSLRPRGNGWSSPSSSARR